MTEQNAIQEKNAHLTKCAICHRRIDYITGALVVGYPAIFAYTIMQKDNIQVSLETLFEHVKLVPRIFKENQIKKCVDDWEKYSQEQDIGFEQWAKTFSQRESGVLLAKEIISQDIWQNLLPSILSALKRAVENNTFPVGQLGTLTKLMIECGQLSAFATVEEEKFVCQNKVIGGLTSPIPIDMKDTLSVLKQLNAKLEKNDASSNGKEKTSTFTQ